LDPCPPRRLGQITGYESDAATLAPNETCELQFLAGERGTYSYWAATSAKPLEGCSGAESMLFGAFLITSLQNFTVVLRKKSVRDEFVNKNLRETLDCSYQHTRAMLPARKRRLQDVLIKCG